MMKCLDCASYQAAFAGVALSATTAPMHHPNSVLIGPLPWRIEASKLRPERKSLFLKEAVRVDVHADSDLCTPFHFSEPVADHVLDVERAAGVDEEALTMSPTQHRQRGRGGAEHGHSFDLGRGMAD